MEAETNADIARRLGISPAAFHKRVKNFGRAAAIALGGRHSSRWSIKEKAITSMAYSAARRDPVHITAEAWAARARYKQIVGMYPERCLGKDSRFETSQPLPPAPPSEPPAPRVKPKYPAERKYLDPDREAVTRAILTGHL